MLTVADLILGLTTGELPPELVAAARDVRIGDVVIDSRRATPGSLFIALRGEHSDGHDYIPQAIAAGSVAVICDRQPPAGTCTALSLAGPAAPGAALGVPVCLPVPDSLQALQRAAGYWRRQHGVRVVGITGSIGKTTAKESIAAVLGRRYRTLKSEGNYNNEIGLPLTLLHLDAAHERVVLEMGMYGPGEITTLAGIGLPHIGVVTNVGPTHLERLGTIERIAQAKAELPQALPPAGEGGVAILNADDERVRAMAGQTPARVFTYGTTPRADLWADEIVSDGLEGIRFRFHYGRDQIRARVPMLGRHSVHTALSAAAVGLVDELSWPDILAGLGQQSAQLRLVAVPGPHGSTLLDDSYNSSPASCIAALNLLGELDGRRIAVLGDMYELGPYEIEGHRLVGRRARDVADLLIAVGRLGRIIGEEAREAGMPAGAVYLAGSNAQAIDLAGKLVRSGDVVLIKGSRGLKMEEIVGALAANGHGAGQQGKEKAP